MRAILIDPFDQTVTEVDYTGPYTQIYDFIQCHTFDAVYINEKDVIYVDDEGLFNSPLNFFQIIGLPRPLAGRGLILATDDEGDTIGTDLPLEWVLNRTHFLQRFVA